MNDSKSSRTAGKIYLSLRGRILLLLVALLMTSLIGAGVTLWVNQRTKDLHRDMVDNGLAGLLAAQSLENDLVMQKGFVTYFFLSGDQDWLENLNLYHRGFEKWLQIARRTQNPKEGITILNNIESRYIRYVYSRDRVIQLYKDGKKNEGASLHWHVREQFQEIRALCEEYKRYHEQRIQDAQDRFEQDTRLLRNFAWFAVFFTFGVGIVLAYILFVQILDPIRRIALEMQKGEGGPFFKDEIKILGKRVHTLLEDVDHAQTELEQSREQIVQSEKMALVGRLAAGVAHSVRNPLTSVKMRLFSLERSLNLEPLEKEDFEVISEEIGHIETILTNFLEFSRPPKLEKHVLSLSDVVDNTFQLIKHRLDSYGFEVNIIRNGRLPNVHADPEQLKEVLMNIIFNACEAMTEGGKIEIIEDVRSSSSGQDRTIVEIRDTGPGIPESIQSHIFEPFFSSKAEGSGLGLSIAKRIMDDHEGVIELVKSDVEGTTFLIGLPCKENKIGNNPDSR